MTLEDVSTELLTSFFVVLHSELLFPSFFLFEKQAHSPFYCNQLLYYYLGILCPKSKFLPWLFAMTESTH